jgi:Tfp pilus assembly protein PilO
VQIRKLTAQAVVSREYHYEMPFEIQVDGPYYSIVDFFSRLSRLSRIINVGNLRFGGLPEGRPQYPVRASTTVTGTCVVTTFFTMPATQATASQTSQPASATGAAR